MGKWSRVKDIVTKPDYSIDPFSGTPPKGMVPSSIPGVYTTPEVIEPTDCDNYPDSIYCGGSPINNTPLDIDIEIKADKCGVSVKAAPTIAYFKFPQTGVAYVAPECRNENPPYTPTPVDTSLSARQRLGGFNRPIFNAEYVYAGVTISSGAFETFTCGADKPPGKGWSCRFSQGFYLQPGYDRTFLDFSENVLPTLVYAKAMIQDVERNSDAICGKSNGEPQLYPEPFEVDLDFNWQLDTRVVVYTLDNDGRVNRKASVGGVVYNTYPENNTPPYSDIYLHSWGFGELELITVYGQWGDIKKYYANVYKQGLLMNIGSTYIFDIDCYDVIRPNASPNHKYNEYRDTFNPVKRCDCMGCCSPSPYEQNKEKEQERKRDECCEEIKKLLKEIKGILGTGKPKIEYYDIDPNKVDAQKKTITPKDLTLAIEEISKLHSITQKAIGVEEFPVQYPDSIVEPVNDNILGQVWDFITPDKVRKITSLAQMIDWGTDQQSATIGKLQRKIEQEVEDNRVQSDGTIKKGSKKVSVVIPDIATGIEEIFKMQLQLFKALGLNTDIGLKGLQEGVNSSVMSAEALQRIKSIQEFLSFPTDHKSVDHTIQITIPEKGKEKDVEKDLLKYLQTSQTKIVWDDFDGSQSFYEMMIDVLGAAAIIRAVFYGRS